MNHYDIYEMNVLSWPFLSTEALIGVPKDIVGVFWVRMIMCRVRSELVAAVIEHLQLCRSLF